MASSPTSTAQAPNPTEDTLESLGTDADAVSAPTPEEETVDTLGSDAGEPGDPALEELGVDAPPANKFSDTNVFAKQVNRGAVEAGIAVPTTAAATATGAAIGTAIFPGLGTLIGGGLGFLFGMGASALASEYVVDSITGSDLGQKFFIDREDIGEDQRALANAGQTFGGAAAGAQALLREGLKYSTRQSVAQLAKAEARGGVVDKVLRSMRVHPATVIASETFAGVGASGGAFVSEKVAPNNIWARFTAEFIGGALIPHRTTAKLAVPAKNLAQRGWLKLTGQAAENDAAAAIQKMVKEYGEDPNALAEALLAENWEALGVDLTPAQKTGSPILAAYEAGLASNRQSTGSLAAEKAAQAYKALDRIARALGSTGDPQLMVKAAQARRAQFEIALTAQVDELQQGLVNRIRGLSDDVPEDKNAVGKQLSEGFTELIKQWRTAESKLWNALDQNVAVEKADNLAEAWTTIKGEMNDPSVESFPGKTAVDFVLNKLKPPETGVSGAEGLGDDAARWAENLLGDGAAPRETQKLAMLINLRSELSDLASQAGRAGKANEARRLNNLKKAVGEDIGEVMGGDPAYVDAVEFSAAGNDVFTRSFLGQKGRGSQELPENALRQAFAGADETVVMHLDELDDATSFMTRKEFDPTVAGPMVKEVMDAQDRFVRLASRAIVKIRTDPNTGEETAVVSMTRLENFLTNRASMLKKFPDVKKRLLEVQKDKAAADAFAKVAKGETSAFKQSVFAKLAGTERPTKLLEDTLFSQSSLTPGDDLDGLINLAKENGPDAVEGLSQTVLNAAIKSSTSSKTGTMDFALLEHNLNSPLEDGGVPLIDILIKRGVFHADMKTTLKKVFEQAANLDLTQAARAGEVDGPLNSAFIDFLVTMGGARAASRMAKLTGPTGAASLKIASGGSALAKKKISDLPLAQFGNLLHRMGNDTKFMAAMLKRPVTVKEKMFLVRNIHAYAMFAGYSAFRDGTEVDKLRPYEGFVGGP